MTKKPKLPVKNPRFVRVLDIYETDKGATYLLGHPGYRTARERSGLGYVESQAELARMWGLMIRWLIAGKFRTHNPFYLFFMFLFGIFFGVVPLALILIAVFETKNFQPLVAALFIPPIPLGIAVFINMLISVWDWDGESITGD